MWIRDKKFYGRKEKWNIAETQKKLSWHKSELKQTHKIWKRISCFSAIIIIQKSLIFTTFSILSETWQGKMKNKRGKKLLKVSWSRRLVFRLMELIKNVKYVVREVMQKAYYRDELSIISATFNVGCMSAVKMIRLSTIEKTVDTINLSQQSIWLCNQFFKKRMEKYWKRTENQGNDGMRKKNVRSWWNLNESISLINHAKFAWSFHSLSRSLWRQMSLWRWSLEATEPSLSFTISSYHFTLSDFHVKKGTACDSEEITPRRSNILLTQLLVIFKHVVNARLESNKNYLLLFLDFAPKAHLPVNPNK
jgi:hypothetical protein